MATVKKTYNGNDLMLFTENNKSLANAQNHAFTVGVETREDNTKDNPRNPIVSVSKITYEITTENLFCEDFVTLFGYLVNGEPVKLKFGQKKDEGEKLPSTGEIEAWTLNGAVNYFEGYFIINNLQLNANTGETCTYSASFAAVGKVEQKNDIKTFSTVNAAYFESLPFSFFWGNGETIETKNLVGIGWDDDVMSNHSVQANNAAYFVPNLNYTLYVYSLIPNTLNMEITFQFVHEFEEESNITLTYNGGANTVHIPTRGTKYTLTLNGADEAVRMESNSFPDIRIIVTDIKIKYTE